MSGAPTTSVITIDGHAIEYRLERREHAAVLIWHGGHMSARCRFGEETFLEAGYSCSSPLARDMAEQLLPQDHRRPNSLFDWQGCLDY